MTIAHTPREADAEHERVSENLPPLVVDLDGTLIKSDLLVEGFFALLHINFLYLFLAPFWLLKGKAHFKEQIFSRVAIDPQLLPYHASFLAFLRQQAQSGRQLVLATASNERAAQRVAKHLGIFNSVLASTGSVNLSGKKKLKAMVEACGENRFDYAGNARVDLQIWPHARNAILVNPGLGVEAAARRVGRVQEVFHEGQRGIAPLLKAMRPHQWLKNVLIFVPLLTAHVWLDPAAVWRSLLAFIAFSLCASSAYIVNDLLDLPSDRAHPRKRRRPLASGDLPPLHGALAAIVLLAAGLSVALLVSPLFTLITVGYLTITLAYSLQLKRYVLMDVIVLAGLYTVRVIAGTAAIAVGPSFWLLSFSMFVFLSLALVKRCAEINTLLKAKRTEATGRDYRVSDLHYLHSMGTASGYLSVLVLALYINSPEMRAQYSNPYYLWLLCPMVLYWISRIWLKTGRDEMHDDPLVFTMKDRGSLFVIAGMILVTLLAL
jgi:4-hydroxybenzoate polyprenyltransferase